MAREFDNLAARFTLATPERDRTVFGKLARQFLAVRESWRDVSAGAFQAADSAMNDALREEYEARDAAGHGDWVL